MGKYSECGETRTDANKCAICGELPVNQFGDYGMDGDCLCPNGCVHTDDVEVWNRLMIGYNLAKLCEDQ